MPVNLSRKTAAAPTEQFYTPIHARMAFSRPRPTLREFTAALDKHAPVLKGLALDAGCGGTASFSAAMAARGAQVVALDVNRSSLLDARAANSGPAGLTFCAASVAAMPFRDATFEFAVSSGVVHHTPDPETAVRDLARVLQPRGILYISIYCFAGSLFEWLVRAWRMLGSVVPFRWMHRLFGWNRAVNSFVLDHMYVPTLWLFREQEARRLLEQSGFSIREDWPSAIDPFARWGRLGSWISGGGLLRVWLCEKR